MNTRTILRRSTALAIAAALLSASPAAAQLGDSSVDCRATIAKSYGKLLKTAHKTLAGCHKSRNKDVTLAGNDCNDMSVADAKGKFAKASDKFEASVTAGCAGQAAILTAANVGGGKEYYISCPVDPCDGVTGVIDSVPELGACLSCQAAAVAEDVASATLGLPNPANLSKEEQKCHGAIAKGYSKYFATDYKNETKCQGTQDGLGNNTLTACTNSLLADPKGTSAKMLTKADEGLVKFCGAPAPVNLTDVGGCSDVDVPTLAACSGAAWIASEDDAFTSTYELEATGCPSSVRTTILGGCSTQGSVEGGCLTGFETGTVLSVGWKGLAHGVDITDSYTIAVDVTCAGTEKGSCGECTSAGVSLDNPQYTDFLRCVADTSRTCDEPFSNDLDCGTCVGGVNINQACTSDAGCPASTCAANACRYFLGPPLAVSAGGTPTCTLNVVNTDIVGGTGDPDLGTADFLVDLRSVVHLGVSQSRPCPYCRNDPTPQDGVKGGTCLGGPHNNDPCDVQGFDLSFANPGAVDAPNSGNSLDCPPTNGANISGSGLAIQLPLTTGVSSKDAVDPCESPNESLDCFCGVCSGDPTVTCESDTDCSNLALGSCEIGGGVARRPNNCSDGICTPVSSDRGVCSLDVDTYCSTVLFSSGKGVIACGVDADCDSYVSGSPNPDNWVCPNDDCGTCSVASFRSCFNDPMAVTGTPDPANPILAGTFCLPPSSNGSVNNATGSPGPGAVQTDTIVELRY